MKRKKSKILFILKGLALLLILFAVLSAVHLQKSFYVYRAAQERRDRAHNEKAYVETHLEDLRTHTQKKQYDSEDTGITKEYKLKKIELRGVELSPDRNTPFSKSEVRFNIIEQE